MWDGVLAQSACSQEVGMNLECDLDRHRSRMHSKREQAVEAEGQRTKSL